MATSISTDKKQSKIDDSRNESWNRVVAKLHFIHGEAVFNSWLRPLKLESITDTSVVMSMPTRFMRDWVISHYATEIQKCWREENSAMLKIDVVVRKKSKEENNITEHHESAVISTYSHTNIKNNGRFENDRMNDLSSTLDPRLTFDNFVVGNTNALAHAAAKRISEADSVLVGSNPLFIYGGVGLGKTHLMHAIAIHIQDNNPKRRVVYLSAEKFMYQFIRALRNRDIVAFKDFFRSVDVLMVDDIQFICRKNSTQEEFFHTFNTLIDNRKQLILSGDRSPCDMDGMEDRIISRLGGGLVADISSTTYELRLGILQSKVKNMELFIPSVVIEFLARKINSNIRELEGALNKVIAHSNLMRREITLDGTRKILRDLLRASERVITIDDIKKTVADHCHIRISDMHSSRRSRSVARPRQMAMFLAKELTSHSFPEIGRSFGGKDHTTVMHAIKRVKELCENDPEIKSNIDILTTMLQK